MQDTPWSIPGIFSTGKTMPESITVGIIRSIPEMIIAVTCLSETAEISSPKANASTR